MLIPKFRKKRLLVNRFKYFEDKINELEERIKILENESQYHAYNKSQIPLRIKLGQKDGFGKR